MKWVDKQIKSMRKGTMISIFLLKLRTIDFYSLHEIFGWHIEYSNFKQFLYFYILESLAHSAAGMSMYVYLYVYMTDTSVPAVKSRMSLPQVELIQQRLYQRWSGPLTCDKE